LPNSRVHSIFERVMKNRMGLVILILICLGLTVVLIFTQSRSANELQKSTVTIGELSNKLEKITYDLGEQRQVNSLLTNELDAHRTHLVAMTNHLTEVSNTLARTEATLKEEVARRDARITELEAQNHALDERAVDLSNAITNLTSQIEDTQKKLSASEGDKAFLEKELHRLIAEKAELERQFNDLTVLRAQVAKLKEELNVARRLQWIREGLFARSEQKGAEQLMQKNTPAFASANREPAPAAKPSQGTYDLNVEVSADGTVRVIPPTTNPAATNAGAVPQ